MNLPVLDFRKDPLVSEEYPLRIFGFSNTSNFLLLFEISYESNSLELVGVVRKSHLRKLLRM